MAHDPNQPERPRVEPEIIPPDRDGGSPDWRRNTYAPWHGSGFEQIRGSRRVYVGRVGPFGIALLLLAIAALIAVIMIAVLGAVLIWIPVIAVAVVAAAFFRLFRR
jgi:fatty acid desaturase